MDINYELSKYKGFLKTYKEIVNGFGDDIDIHINNKPYDDENEIVLIKIYKSEYNYADLDTLRKLYNNDELFIYINSVIINKNLSLYLINTIRNHFVNNHDMLIPCFDKYGNQILKSKSHTLAIRIHSDSEFKEASKVQSEIIKKQRKP